MDYYTIGVNFYPTYIHPLNLSRIKGMAFTEREECFRIIFTGDGVSRFMLNEKEYILMGTHVICLSELDRFSSVHLPEEGWMMKFIPAVINYRFNFDNIQTATVENETDYQDIFYLYPFLHNVDENKKMIRLDKLEASIFEQKLRIIFDQIILQDNQFWPCRSRSYLFELLFSISQPNVHYPQYTALMEDYSQLTTDVLYYIQASYDQKLTLEHLAERFHTNRTTLLAGFKHDTGQSVGKYLRHVRLSMAATMLRDTSLNISEISERTGFNDQSHFTKEFKRELSYTPSEYRKIHIEE